ncbi:MAG TPA: hypothetical protein VF735_05490 [Pyrinomonadaceae bacterium]|jgi:hypothetical protein
MAETNKPNDDAPRPDSTTTHVGDVETAGETVAADTISGPPDTRPVGADTLAKVNDKSDSAESVSDLE